MSRLRALNDPFLIALTATVVLASLLPPRGGFAPVVAGVAHAAIVALFFLHGAKLSREAIIAGAGNWRLHAAVFAATFLIFPLIGIGVSTLPFLTQAAATGLLFLTLVPSTVQSSIAFTAISRGNVAAAVCSASFSNLAGILLTPLLVAATIGGRAALSWHGVTSVVLQLLLPFVVGHLMRPWVGAFVARHKGMLTFVDRGSILLIVYSAFGAAVVDGIWHRMSPGAVGVIVLCCCAMLAAILAISWGMGRLFGFARADAIVLLFCGSKKSLASGVPIAGVLFPPAEVGIVILPLMLFHQIQLIVGAVIARHYATQPVDDGPVLRCEPAKVLP